MYHEVKEKRKEFVDDYYLFSKGKPETPTDILVSDITSSSFKIQFSPSFDGGSGSQQFIVQITDSSNSTTINQQIPSNNYEYTIKGRIIRFIINSFEQIILLGLNESTLYSFRIKSTNIYGDSPWSHEIPVQTNELIITSEGIILNTYQYSSNKTPVANQDFLKGYIVREKALFDLRKSVIDM